MVKDEALPAKKGTTPCNNYFSNLMQQADMEIKMYEEMSDANKAASENIHPSRKLFSIPCQNW